ncbi:CaiB/BaiF CoA transferase family protein [Natrinema caseinilyticum]|uniref:CaiB/BaiF CoA transferase family protein n=1 Tax=Natrinema caseinilyticum TaxID=2961570 RepID=UPI0020C54DF2|nr:CaiB/BaiF CoA-transferase family protein [Natrinema caseinilyticum]
MQPFLDGVRILDLTQLLPGPYATTMLADLGAEVIKVERPGTGDPVRPREPSIDGRSFTLLTRHRNKKSIAINLKHEGGRDAFLDLARTADVVVESFRPGVVDRLGVGYDDVRDVNEDVIYCSISGYGQDGPYVARSGHDLNYIGVAGLLGLTGDRDGPPTIPGYPIADFAGGMYAAFAIATALAGVRGGSGGDHIDVSMTDAVASFSMVYLDRYEGRGEIPRRGRTTLTGSHPGYRVYETGDGKAITLGALEEHFWENLCEALELPEYADDHIGPNGELPDSLRTEIVDAFADRLAERPRAAWLERFEEYDVPAGPVNDYEDLFADPHLEARGLFDEIDVGGDGDRRSGESVRQINLPLDFERFSPDEKTPAPYLGANTAELLDELGYSDAEIETLLEAGAVAETGDH